MGRELLAQQVVVDPQHRLGPHVAQPVGELGVALEVGEHDRDAPRGIGMRTQVGLLPAHRPRHRVDRRGDVGAGVDPLERQLHRHRLVDELRHPDGRRGVERVVQQPERAIAIAGTIPPDEPDREVVPVPSGPGGSAERLVELERALEIGHAFVGSFERDGQIGRAHV